VEGPRFQPQLQFHQNPLWKTQVPYFTSTLHSIELNTTMKHNPPWKVGGHCKGHIQFLVIGWIWNTENGWPFSDTKFFHGEKWKCEKMRKMTALFRFSVHFLHRRKLEPWNWEKVKNPVYVVQSTCDITMH
jgi:hypothetical protein